MTKEERSIVDNILDNFDFMKVHLVMETLGWEWRGAVPSISRIIRTADDLMCEAIEKKVYRIGTGGFYVTRKEYDEGGFNIELIFSLSSWDEDSV